MTTLRTATLAAALVAGATSLTMAQNAPGGGNNGMPPEAYKGPGAYQGYKAEDFQQKSNTGANAAANGGGGTRATGQRTGRAQNTQRVLPNQNGNRARVGAAGPAVGGPGTGVEGWRGGLGYGYGLGYGNGYGGGYGYGAPNGYAGLYSYAPGYSGGGYPGPGYGGPPGVAFGEPPGLYDEFVGYQWGR